MEYVLPAALVLGILLFVIGWLVVIVQGFNRHPLTGILALIPGLNLLILPSLWHRVGAWFIVSLVGFLLAAGSWGMGGIDQLQQQLQSRLKIGGLPVTHALPDADKKATDAAAVQPPPPAPPPAPAPETTPLNLPSHATAPAPATSDAGSTPPMPPQANAAAPTPATSAAPAPAPATSLPLPVMNEDLPDNALYRMEFKAIDLVKLDDASGKYVRITQNNGREREGKLLAVANNQLTLEERDHSQVSTQTVNVSDVRQVAVMMKSNED